MLNLTFKKIKDEKPLDNQEIFYIHDGFYGVGLQHGVVEYSWSIVDERGNHTGSGICYHPDDEKPEDAVLIYVVNGARLDDNDYWASVDDLYDQFDKERG